MKIPTIETPRLYLRGFQKEDARFAAGLVEHMPNPDNLGVDDRRAQFNIYLSQLKHWK